MTDATPGMMRRLLAEEFDRRGWAYEPSVVSGIVEAIEWCGEVEPERLAQKVPLLFLERNHASRDTVVRAIQQTLGGVSPTSAEMAAMLIINDQRYSLNMAADAQITGGNVNIGSTQINLQNNASKEEMLAAVGALVRAGLNDGWNSDAATALAGAIEARNDIAFEDVQRVSIKAVEEQEPTQGRAKELLAKVAVSGAGGALATGISAGVGELLHLLPT